MAATRKEHGKHQTRWTSAFGFGILTVGLVLALGSYHPQDPSLNTFSSNWKAPVNVLGYAGSWLSDALFQLVGVGAWLVPSLIFVALVRWLVARDHRAPIMGTRAWVALTLLLASLSLLCDLVAQSTSSPYPTQGLFGVALGALCKPLVGRVGSFLVVLALLWTFCMVWWESLPARFVSFAGQVGAWAWAAFGNGVARMKASKSSSNEASDAKKIRVNQEDPRKISAGGTAVQASPENDNDESDEDENDDELEEGEGDDDSGAARQPVIRMSTPDAATPTPAPRAKAVRAATSHPTDWHLPPLSLLEHSKKKTKAQSEEQLRATARKIEAALRSFEIEGEVTEITPGPIITMYEFQPGPGIRVQKLVSVATDLAMSISAPSIRVVAPIPGKSVAGIEVPNPDKEEIVLRDVFESTLERAKTQKLPLTLGKDGEGRPVCEDLARMPHLLVGGATSMGKSVLVNSILTGLLCRYTPEELRLIIVDPKLVEFQAFMDIPHLLLPIVNDPSDASQSLKWAVGETKRRYLLMQKFGAKNIEAFNSKVESFDKSQLKDGEEEPGKFPYIVIIIDELAELMLTAKKDVEQSIVRLSQLARAAGIHLIMATQRPSADIVTGLIKSNCPARAALRVSSASDSRIILDCAGAEQLLGRGDTFFTNSGPMGLRRLQSPYVSDGEIEKICDFWRDQGEPEYRDEILQPDNPELDAELGGDSGEGRDSLYGDVLSFAREKRVISTSLIQRRFQIGYTRAARIMEQLEQAGIVGEQTAAGKPRDVIA